MSKAKANENHPDRRSALAALLMAPLAPGLALALQDPIALEEAKRIEVVKRVSPSVVAVVTGAARVW